MVPKPLYFLFFMPFDNSGITGLLCYYRTVKFYCCFSGRYHILRNNYCNYELWC